MKHNVLDTNNPEHLSVIAGLIQSAEIPLKITSTDDGTVIVEDMNEVHLGTFNTHDFLAQTPHDILNKIGVNIRG